MARPLDIDADPVNADWTKQTWDLPRDPHELRALLRALGIPPAKFLRLPIARFQLLKRRRASGGGRGRGRS